jgi:NAD-dependent SIR2 family protein deacetylase
MHRYGCFARIIYTRGKQRIADGITLNSDEMHMPPEMRDQIIEAQFEIALASCRDCAQTPSERARAARIRRTLHKNSLLCKVRALYW